MKERLRVIKDPLNVRLLYDVLQYDPPEVEKAVLFITDNVLVCDTQEDAMKVAFQMDESHAAVALDGTFYQKSGLISGGSRLVVTLTKLHHNFSSIVFSSSGICRKRLPAGTISSSVL